MSAFVAMIVIVVTKLLIRGTVTTTKMAMMRMSAPGKTGAIQPV
jgi:hypothetical protein